MFKLSLKKTIPIAFLVPILTCVTLLGVTAVLTEEHTAEKFSKQSMGMLKKQIKQKLNNFLYSPQIINKINTDAILARQLNLQDYKSMELLLRNQIQAFKNINGIEFGYESGGEIRSIVRETENGELSYNIADKSTNMNSVIYGTDEKGNRAKETSRDGKYNARERFWYQEAVKAGKATWTSISAKKVTKNTQLRLSAVNPVYEEKSGKLLGVWAVDIFLNQINEFLVQITQNTDREIFIVEPNGKLVAASIKEQVFDDKGNQIQAINFNQEPLIQETAKYIENKISGGFGNIVGDKGFKFTPPGRSTELVQILHFKNEDKQYKGIDWVVVIVVPEKEFMQDFEYIRTFAIVMDAGVILFSLSLGLLITRWLAKPILELSHAAEQITSEEFDLASLENTLEPIVKRPDELGELAEVFKHMAQEVYNREIHLKNKVNQLADKANQAALAKQSDVQTLLARSQKARDKT